MRALICLTLLIAGCGAPNEQRQAAEREHERAVERNADALDGTSYQDYRGDSGCTSDCSGHDAGWQWAQENGIADIEQCVGNSQSFEEGCRAYINAQNGEE